MNFSIRKHLQFTGRRVGLWLGFSSVAGFFLTFLEISISVVLALLLAVLGVSAPGAALPFGLDAQLGTTFSSPAAIGVTLLVIAVLRGGAQWTVSQAASYSQEMIATRLRFLALHDILATRKGFASLSLLQSRFGETFPRAAGFCNQIAYFIPLTLQSVLIIGLLLWKSPREALYGGVGMVLVGGLVHLVATRIRKIAEALPSEHLALQSRISRVVRNWFLVQALRTNSSEWKGIAAHQSDYSLRLVRGSGLSHFANILPLVLGMALIVVLIGVHLHSPSQTGVEFLAFLYLYLRLVQGLSTLAGVLGNIQSTMPFYRDARNFFFSFTPEFRSEALEPLRYGFAERGSALSQDRFPDADRVIHATESRARPAPPEVQVEGLGFAYPGMPQPVLQGLSFQVAAGGQFAILGKSGSGKSTLLALVMGLLVPSAGKVRIGSREEGRDPEAYFARYPGSLGYVGAEPFLVEGSLRENLVYGLDRSSGRVYSDEDFRSVLERVQLGEWLKARPEGLSYRISENGEGLSMGQKQRLSLARALLSEPSVLILDEVSANLDETTEGEIAKVIASLAGRCTTLIVTHREGMVSHVQTRKTL